MQDLVITNSGKSLATKALLEGFDYQFTKIKLSSFDYSAQNLKVLESLNDIKQEQDISKSFINDEMIVDIFSAVSNQEVDEGYYIRTIGLYTIDNENNEILYGVCISNTVADYMPPKSINICGFNYHFIVKVDDTENIEITMNSSQFVTNEQLSKELESLNDRLENKPKIRLATVVHNLGYYPVIQVLSTKGAYGIGGYSETVYGGSDTITEITRQKHNDRNSFELLVGEDLAFENPVLNVVSEGYEYCITFDNTDTSLVILLSSVQKNIVDDNGDETIEIDTYTKEEIDYKNGSSTFIVHVNGGQENWNSNDPNTSYFPPTTNTWYDIPAKFSHLVDANNSKSYKFYTDFEVGDSEVALVNDIAEKVERIEFEIMCFLQNQLWYNTSVRLIAHKPGVSSTEYLGNSLGFSEDTVLLAQRDFVASNGQRTASVSSRSLRTLLRDSETGALIDRNGWILRFQILTDNTQDYISDKSYVGITFIHKK